MLIGSGRNVEAAVILAVIQILLQHGVVLVLYAIVLRAICHLHIGVTFRTLICLVPLYDFIRYPKLILVLRNVLRSSIHIALVHILGLIGVTTRIVYYRCIGLLFGILKLVYYLILEDGWLIWQVKLRILVRLEAQLVHYHRAVLLL